MRTVIDLTGRVFGKWLVLRRDVDKKSRVHYWICRCACGAEKSIQKSQLIIGGSSSCRPCSMTIHGRSNTSEYTIWKGIKDRCFNPKDAAYNNYGGRGIRVCDEWKDSFKKFYEDMGSRPSLKHSLDRVDNNGNYTKENCRWVGWETQNRNKRIRKDNTSGCTGVSWCRRNSKWRVFIRYGNKPHIVGYFESLENAIASRWVAEATYWES